MATVYKYRVWCDTESGWQYVWAESEPTDCPNDPGHTIDSDKTTVVEASGDAQAYTEDGAAIMTKKDRAELSGNAVLLKRLDTELAPESSTSDDWVIPDGKTWNVRTFAASCMSYEVEAKLEFFRVTSTTTTTAPATTTTAPPDAGFERVNPFDNDVDEPISVLKLDGNSDATPFYESLPFVGDGESFLRITIANKDALDSVEASAYFNGYETDTPT